jgi:hypothetical protein
LAQNFHEGSYIQYCHVQEIDDSISNDPMIIEGAECLISLKDSWQEQVNEEVGKRIMKRLKDIENIIESEKF